MHNIVDDALARGGTCTGEHGIGLGKIDALVQEHGDLIPLMQAIKAGFDPNGILNPGKVLPETPAARATVSTVRPYRLGVDIGGTFTDVVLLGDDGSVRAAKVLSTPDDYARGVVDGAVALLAELRRHGRRDRRRRPRLDGRVEHRARGARREDGARDDQGLPRRARDAPPADSGALRHPVPRARSRSSRAGSASRSTSGSARAARPGRSSTRARCATSRSRSAQDDVEAVAIALLHSYADDAHERRVEEIVREAVGDGVYVTRSSEILPEIREYERTSTAVVNAYVGPAITRYIGSLVDACARPASRAQLEVMQSSGGTLTPETARRKPAHLVESGPAAGVMACSYLGRLTGRRHLISLDMGGTTAKAAIVEDGQPVRTSEYEVGAGINLSSKLVKGGGYPIKLPFIDVSEIGAGGGSIVAIDELGNVTVGPRQRRRRCRGRSATGSAAPSRRSPTRCSRSATSTRRSSAAARSRSTPQRSRGGARPRRRDAARPVGRGGRLRDPDARRRDDDPRRQGGHDLPRPRPARLHAVRVRRQRPADRRRDRPRARDAATC